LVNQTSDNFVINLNNPAGSLKGSWRICEVFIGNNSPNCSSYNNTIVFTESTTKTATIPPGFYSGTSTFAAAVASALTTASGSLTYTCTVNTNGTVTISATGNFVLNWSSPSATAWQILGFVPADTNPSASSQTGTGILDLSNSFSKTAFNIVLGGYQSTSGTTYTTDGACLAMVLPVNSNTQSFCYYIAPSHEYAPTLTFFEDAVALRVQVLDDFGRPFGLGLTNWYFVMQRNEDSVV